MIMMGRASSTCSIVAVFPGSPLRCSHSKVFDAHQQKLCNVGLFSTDADRKLIFLFDSLSLLYSNPSGGTAGGPQQGILSWNLAGIQSLKSSWRMMYCISFLTLSAASLKCKKTITHSRKMWAITLGFSWRF